MGRGTNCPQAQFLRSPPQAILETQHGPRGAPDSWTPAHRGWTGGVGRPDLLPPCPFRQSLRKDSASAFRQWCQKPWLGILSPAAVAGPGTGQPSEFGNNLELAIPCAHFVDGT